MRTPELLNYLERIGDYEIIVPIPHCCDNCCDSGTEPLTNVFITDEGKLFFGGETEIK